MAASPFPVSCPPFLLTLLLWNLQRLQNSESFLPTPWSDFTPECPTRMPAPPIQLGGCGSSLHPGLWQDLQLLCTAPAVLQLVHLTGFLKQSLFAVLCTSPYAKYCASVFLSSSYSHRMIVRRSPSCSVLFSLALFLAGPAGSQSRFTRGSRQQCSSMRLRSKCQFGR